MPYKISGTLSEDSRVIVLKESDWSIESNTVISGGEAYEIDGLEEGKKLTLARTALGETIGYGNVASTYYPPVPLKAVSPTPNDSVDDQDIDVDISWSDGGGATSYDVYFGTDSTPDVSEFKGNQPETTYEPGTLETSDTYYWRIDSKNETGTTTGDIWNFDTETGYVSGDRGLFAGGNAPSATNSIEYITISVASNSSDFGDLAAARQRLAATSNGGNDRGVFGGGRSEQNKIEYLSISALGNSSDFGDLTVGRELLSATSNGVNNRGIFGGGEEGGYKDVIDYVTVSVLGNATNFGNLTAARKDLTACSNGTNDRGIFTGGQWPWVDTIEYITISTTGNALNFGDLPSDQAHHTSTSNGTNNRGIIAGGHNGLVVLQNIRYITIPTLSNTVNFGNLSNPTWVFMATSNGSNNRGIFAGGNSSNTIEYITISSTGNAVDFGDLPVARTDAGATSDA